MYGVPGLTPHPTNVPGTPAGRHETRRDGGMACGHKNAYVVKTVVKSDGTVWTYYWCPDCEQAWMKTTTEGG
jgi:hypothetical protein